MAQYSVGHQDRMQHTTARLATLPSLRLAGNAYEGIGIPDCIRMGRRAAKEPVAAPSFQLLRQALYRKSLLCTKA